MSEEELSQIITTYTGIDTKVRGNEVVVQQCISCANPRWNLEVNLHKGVFNCWACRFKGSVNDLLAKIGYSGEYIPVTMEEDSSKKEPTEEDISVPFGSALDHPDAVRYLEMRGIESWDIRTYDIRYCPTIIDSLWANRVIFPLKDYFGGEVVGYQGRTIVGKEPKYKISHKLNEFVGYQHNSDIHVIVEGVFDAIKVNKAGFNVGMLLGVGNVSDWKLWASRLWILNQTKICIMLDGSATKEARQLYRIITQVHEDCQVINLDSDQDPGGMSPQEIKTLVEECYGS